MTEKPLDVGDRLHGFCGGAFGRDHYECGTVEALGTDWVVLRASGSSGSVATATGTASDIQSLTEYRMNEEGGQCPFFDRRCYFEESP